MLCFCPPYWSIHLMNPDDWVEHFGLFLEQTTNGMGIGKSLLKWHNNDQFV